MTPTIRLKGCRGIGPQVIIAHRLCFCVTARILKQDGRDRLRYYGLALDLIG